MTTANEAQEVQETGIVTIPQNQLGLAGLDLANLNLEEGSNNVQDIELASSYWTPEKAGEKRIVVFLGIQNREIFDEDTGELTETLQTVNMAALIEGNLTQVSNASKRLVGIFNNAIFQPGMKFQVEYLGKKVSTKGTGHKYDDWSVKPVVSK